MMSEDDGEVMVVSLTTEVKEAGVGNVGKQIWHEMTAGVGFWGTLRPLIAVALAIIPFLFLGQHFNRKHRKSFDFFFLQIPLSFTLILWIGLYVWSIFDAWKDSSILVADNSGP
jgi:hypothetical protein